MKCDLTHAHFKKRMEDEEEDSEIGSDVSLPFHLRMHMNPKILSRERNMVPDIKDKPS
jgi:hypothetical protein